jgi:hypothetical protein
MAKFALLSSAELNKKIAGIGKASAKLTRDIQVAAVNAIGYSIEYGDITIGQRLFDALGSSMRRQALVSYFEKNGQFCWSSSEKKFVFFKVEGIKFNPDLLMTMPWDEAKKEAIVSEIDVEDMVKKMIKKIENSIEKGIEVKHKDLYSDLTHCLARYHSDLADADADEEPMLKAA